MDEDWAAKDGVLQVVPRDCSDAEVCNPRGYGGLWRSFKMKNLVESQSSIQVPGSFSCGGIYIPSQEISPGGPSRDAQDAQENLTENRPPTSGGNCRRLPEGKTPVYTCWIGIHRMPIDA